MYLMLFEIVKLLRNLSQGFRQFLYYFKFMNRPYHYRGLLKLH